MDSSYVAKCTSRLVLVGHILFCCVASKTGVVGTKMYFTSSMSRMFRMFLLLASVVLAVFFAYHNRRGAPQHQPQLQLLRDRWSSRGVARPASSHIHLLNAVEGLAAKHKRKNGLSEQHIADNISATHSPLDKTDSTRVDQSNGRVDNVGLPRKRVLIFDHRPSEQHLGLDELVRAANVTRGRIASKQIDDLKWRVDDMRSKKVEKKVEIFQHTDNFMEQLKQNGFPANFHLDTLKDTKAMLKLITGGKDHIEKQYHRNTEEDVIARSKQPIFIVILARMRTGSTFVGEIFNQNPSLFYIYEPLISLDPYLRAGQLRVFQHENISSHLLYEYSNCRYPEIFTKTWLKWNGGSVRSNKIKPLCKSYSHQIGTKNCSNIVSNQLGEICLRSHHRVAMKTIRADLDYFKPLVEGGVNVKIIHLVRDPRGTANSRRLYYTVNRPKLPKREGARPKFKGRLDFLGLIGNYPDHVVHTIPRLCQWTRDSILEAKSRPEWLRNRYKLVRYEDFALDPLRTARDIYDFLGIDYPRDVMEWIVANTKSSDSRSTKLFSTHKNSIATAMHWRHSMNAVQVRQVEDLCGEAMKLLGYKAVLNPEQLTNDSISLIEPLPMANTI